MSISILLIAKVSFFSNHQQQFIQFENNKYNDYVTHN